VVGDWGWVCLPNLSCQHSYEPRSGEQSDNLPIALAKLLRKLGTLTAKRAHNLDTIQAHVIQEQQVQHIAVMG
jgi:hypothetical protein